MRLEEINPFGIEEVQKERKEKDSQLKERHLNDLKRVISMAEGRRFVWRLLSECGVFRGSATGDTNSTFLNEGRRDIGLFVLQELFEANPAALIQMRAECLADKLNSKN